MTYNLGNMLNFLKNTLEGKRNSEERIGKTKVGSREVSTIKATDTGRYETALIAADGHIVIIEEYETADAAIAGHEKWVKQAHIPEVVRDVHYGDLKEIKDTEE